MKIVVYSVDIMYKGEDEYETFYACEDEWVCSEIFENIVAEPHMRAIIDQMALNMTEYDGEWNVLGGMEEDYWRNRDGEV